MNVIGNQEERELVKFLDLVHHLNVKRYLEIGSRNGNSFASVMSVVGIGGFGHTIDLTENNNTQNNLLNKCSMLREFGCEIVVTFGNSTHHHIIHRAAQYAPYDLILIDADHTYEGVKKDWDNYHTMAPIIALHDVDAPDGWMSSGLPNEVGKFWRELKVGRKTEEYITPGSKMGYGIVYQW